MDIALNDINSTPAISIVLDVDTSYITGKCNFSSHLKKWKTEIESTYEDDYEIILCSSKWSEGSVALINNLFDYEKCTYIVENTGYYGLKNLGALIAKGNIIFFGDCDCQPTLGYFSILKNYFDDIKVLSVAGVTIYNGKSVLTLINTVLSFGYLHQGTPIPTPYSAMAHNIAILHKILPVKPFGDFEGRTGGDRYLTDKMLEIGNLILCPDLKILHEDPTFSIRGKLDRHLIEHFNHLANATKINNKNLLLSLWNAIVSPKKRIHKLLRYGPSMGLKWPYFVPALIMIVIDTLLDVIAVTTIICFKPFRKRWIEYQYGNQFDVS